jgi:stage IV sporulation protein B
LLFKKLSITLVVVLTLCLQITSVSAAELLLGGDSIGIELQYDGVLITGTYDISIDNKKYNPSSDGYRSGDLIMSINGHNIQSISSLMSYIDKEINQGKDITLKIKRDKKILEKKLYYQKINNKYSTGLYVQDGISGVGTLTYYNPDTQTFGALGHMMDDVAFPHDELDKGHIYHSYVKSIQPSQNGKPGEKIAEIGTIEIGTVGENNNYGIFGKYDKGSIQNNHQTISTASIDEVKLGKAYFLTVLEGHKVTKCSINITHLKQQSQSSMKGISFTITDKKVLSLTHGVVQGMSGSPIIQNGKLIGCVTHVDVNDVKKGYGLYIDWMLENEKS